SEELLPPALRDLFWTSRESAQTVLIVSDEVCIPIPWELLRIQDPTNPASGFFLVEAFRITRWLTGAPQTLELPLRRIALVAPRDSALPHVKAERAWIKALDGPTRQVVEVPAWLAEVNDALASGEFEGIHFAGHGFENDGNRRRWSIQLEDYEQLDYEHLYGRARQLGQGRPLVFLNACHSARGATSLTGMGGLAHAFLQAGAGAFIGSYWMLNDLQACRFAAGLYGNLLAGMEIGEAAQMARLELRDQFPRDYGWLAYTVFAHPLARCVEAPAAADSSPPLQTSLQRPSRTKPGPVKKTRKRKPGPPVQVDQVEEARRRSPSIQVAEPPPPASVAAEPSPGEGRVHEKDGTILVYVPGGEITMGAVGVQDWSRPVHRVRLHPFWIGKFPITNEQYARFLSENPEAPEPRFWRDPQLNQPRHPVVGVSWDEAQAYCQWAGLELPSEAQWEAAARGRDQRPYPWGRGLPAPLQANFGGIQKGTTPVDAHPAGCGPYGTFDQAGNVWEWCVDPWSSTAYQRRESGLWDPVARGEAAVRAIRGGSWNNPASDLHAACRERVTTRKALKNLGFRCLWRPA
ncbi:MAG TPA: SUMF1/EgtB/PvdO family nonheme iron enzyme, partial [Thermoanaerobaculia bacterium]|nr:SUMF1/EgtB/PvdO family nonheme iron enzyme [Thermoanaerobaculia bacterium]